MVTDVPDAMAEIQAARRINILRNIAEMPMRANGDILQVLEGEDAKVSKAHRSIKTDKRYKDPSVLSKTEFAERHFLTLGMGFRRLPDTETGYSSLLQWCSMQTRCRRKFAV